MCMKSTFIIVVICDFTCSTLKFPVARTFIRYNNSARVEVVLRGLQFAYTLANQGPGLRVFFKLVESETFLVQETHLTTIQNIAAWVVALVQNTTLQVRVCHDSSENDIFGDSWYDGVKDGVAIGWIFVFGIEEIKSGGVVIGWVAVFDIDDIKGEVTIGYSWLESCDWHRRNQW